jgi:hypothetical protein
MSMQNVTESLPCESMNQTPLLQDSPPLYAKCLSCPDFVTACRGVDLTLLSGAAEKRAYHKAIRKEFGFLLKDIYPLVKHVIGKTTTDEYFGPGSGDYKWTTVVTIHNALLSLVAQKKGMPLCENSCSASSSEVRNQLAAADLNIAAANLNLANKEAECDDLRRRLADSDGSHLLQIAELQSAKQSETEWMKSNEEWFKKEAGFWRRLAFILLGIGIILLACLIFYIAWDVAHPASGLIRY